MALEVIGANNIEDLEYKYDIRTLVQSDGQVFGYYFIDPKLSIKISNTGGIQLD